MKFTIEQLENLQYTKVESEQVKYHFDYPKLIIDLFNEEALQINPKQFSKAFDNANTLLNEVKELHQQEVKAERLDYFSQSLFDRQFTEKEKVVDLLKQIQEVNLSDK